MATIFLENGIIDDSIKISLERKLKKYGDFKYSYLVIDKKNTAQIKIISNYPSEWIELYKLNKFQYIDPVVVSALNRIAPFSWDDNIRINSDIKLLRIFKYSKSYNIVNGYTFILHDNYYNMALLSLVIDDKGDCSIEDIIESNQEKIQMLLIKSHDKMLSMYKDVTSSRHVKLPDKKHIFSKRENDILYWSSMGKTYHDIAIILNIKVGTVKFHMGKVVKKLGVLNAKHAIRLGIELNIITPP